MKIFIEFFNSSLNAWYKLMKNQSRVMNFQNNKQSEIPSLNSDQSLAQSPFIHFPTIILICYILSFYYSFSDTLKLHIILCVRIKQSYRIIFNLISSIKHLEFWDKCEISKAYNPCFKSTYKKILKETFF